MSGFKKPMPLQLKRVETASQSSTWQAKFESMEAFRMKLFLPENQVSLEFGSDITVHFRDNKHSYQFDSTVLSEREGEFIYIRKPKVIYKRRL
ncbi:hypothetical protein [Leptospira ryugenii]|uniref:hypothetical protein n=1 Tax=Leptospira ryugenii TaxID=1917863 RepID=UPI00107F0F6C|nr:hypothetical protein [Leptospira ryugenii]